MLTSTPLACLFPSPQLPRTLLNDDCLNDGFEGAARGDPRKGSLMRLKHNFGLMIRFGYHLLKDRPNDRVLYVEEDMRLTSDSDNFIELVWNMMDDEMVGVNLSGAHRFTKHCDLVRDYNGNNALLLNAQFYATAYHNLETYCRFNDYNCDFTLRKTLQGEHFLAGQERGIHTGTTCSVLGHYKSTDCTPPELDLKRQECDKLTIVDTHHNSPFRPNGGWYHPYDVSACQALKVGFAGSSVQWTSDDAFFLDTKGVAAENIVHIKPWQSRFEAFEHLKGFVGRFDFDPAYGQCTMPAAEKGG